MRIAQGILIAAALLALGPGSAHGWSGTFDGNVQAGPALSTAGMAWADGQYQRGPMTIKRAPLNAPPDYLFSVTRLATCDRVDDLAASGSLVAVLVYRGELDGSCLQRGAEVVVGGGGGPTKSLATGGDFAPCSITGMDLDGETLAVARNNCQDHPVVLYDYAKLGSEEAGAGETDLGMPLPPGSNPIRVRMAGRFVAVLLENFANPRFEVLVWDREAGREAYRVDGHAFFAPADWVVGSQRLELQPDGKILFGITTEGFVTRYGVASVEDPVLRAVPGDFDMTRGRVGFSGGLTALQRRNGAGSGVFGGDGGLLNLFSARPTIGSIDFDGSRLAWVGDDLLHNEPFPFTPPSPAAPPAPAPAPGPKPAAAPVATTSVKTRLKARSLKAIAGTAVDADGDLARVRVGLVRLAGKRCETLQKTGKLKRTPKVNGRCLPTSFLDAKGTARWKLTLRKRLPRGKYALYVHAADSGGRAHVLQKSLRLT